MSYASIEFAQVIAQTLKDNFGHFNREQTVILDYGCGDGLLTSFLHELFCQARVIGVDKPSVIIQAKKEFPDLEFEPIEFIMTCTPESLDMIYLANVLHHVPVQHRQSLLKQLTTLLKPDGCLAIVELNPYNIFTRIAHSIDPFELDTQLIAARGLKKLLPHRGYVKYYGSLPSIFLKNEKARLMSMCLPWGSWYLAYFVQ